MKATIHCDGCHAEIADQAVADYHNKACEKCGYTPLISDHDLFIAKCCDFLERLGILTTDPSKKKLGMIEFEINTAPDRDKP